MEAGPPGEGEVGPIEEGAGAGRDRQAIEQGHGVDTRRREEADGGDGAAEIQEGVELHSPRALPSRGQGAQGERELDRRRGEGSDGLREVSPERHGGIATANCREQAPSEGGDDPPVAPLVGMGERVARDGTPEA